MTVTGKTFSMPDETFAVYLQALQKGFLMRCILRRPHFSARVQTFYAEIIGLHSIQRGGKGPFVITRINVNAHVAVTTKYLNPELSVSALLSWAEVRARLVDLLDEWDAHSSKWHVGDQFVCLHQIGESRWIVPQRNWHVLFYLAQIERELYHLAQKKPEDTLAPNAESRQKALRELHQHFARFLADAYIQRSMTSLIEG